MSQVDHKYFYFLGTGKAVVFTGDQEPGRLKHAGAVTGSLPRLLRKSSRCRRFCCQVPHAAPRCHLQAAAQLLGAAHQDNQCRHIDTGRFKAVFVLLREDYAHCLAALC